LAPAPVHIALLNLVPSAVDAAATLVRLTASSVNRGGLLLLMLLRSDVPRPSTSHLPTGAVHSVGIWLTTGAIDASCALVWLSSGAIHGAADHIWLTSGPVDGGGLLVLSSSPVH